MLTNEEKNNLKQCTLLEIAEVSVDFVTEFHDGRTPEGELLAKEAHAGNIFSYDSLVKKPWSLSYLDEVCRGRELVVQLKNIARQYGYEAIECFTKDGFVWLSVLLTSEHFNEQCAPLLPSYMKRISGLTFEPTAYSLSFPCRYTE
ncbi:TPA: hypothetical protein ACF3I9_004386 [Klebsiella aerogenes]